MASLPDPCGPLSDDAAAAAQEAAGASANANNAQSRVGFGPASDSPAAAMLEQLSSLPEASAAAADTASAGAHESTSSGSIHESTRQPASTPGGAADAPRAVAEEPRAIVDSTALPSDALPPGQAAGQETDGAIVGDPSPGPVRATPAAQGPKSVLDRLQRPSSAALQSPNKSKYARSESQEAGVKMVVHPIGELAHVASYKHGWTPTLLLVERPAVPGLIAVDASRQDSNSACSLTAVL